jgi:predicted nucleic acid-binding protein
MPVIDASPLIYLGKIDKLHILKKFYGVVKCPPSVYKEVVVKGREKDYIDARVVEKAVGDYVIIQHPQEETTNKITQHAKARGYRLGKGEIEGIALCMDTGEKIYLCDDEDAKNLAQIQGIKGKGTIYLLLKAYTAGIFSKQDCRDAFVKIMESGLWVSPKIVEIFYRKLEASIKT